MCGPCASFTVACVCVCVFFFLSSSVRPHTSVPLIFLARFLRQWMDEERGLRGPLEEEEERKEAKGEAERVSGAAEGPSGV